MSRYFFHLHFLNELVTDPEGTELPDLEAAKTEARQFICEMAADYLRGGREFRLVSVRIYAEGKEMLTEVPVSEGLRKVLVPDVFMPSPPDNLLTLIKSLFPQ